MSSESSAGVKCPECDADCPLPADVISGEIVQCAECAAELEVVSLDPPALELAPEEDEDFGE